MSIERLVLGIGAGLLGITMTLAMPVNVRRVNQTLISVVVITLFFVSAIALLSWPTWLIAAAIASIVAIILRDIYRFIRHVYWDATKYTRRDYWYRRVGETILNGGRRKRRRHL